MASGIGADNTVAPPPDQQSGTTVADVRAPSASAPVDPALGDVRVRPANAPVDPALGDVRVRAADVSARAVQGSAFVRIRNTRPGPTVAVAGVGGAGVNAVTRLIDIGLEGVRFLAIDTSDQTLLRARGAQCIALGALTRGLGTGADQSLGAEAARAARTALADALAGSDLVFVAAGLAGGTGGGAAPQVAYLARAAGAVTVGFGVMPFAFEAPRRATAADVARRVLAAACDATVILDNERALQVAGRRVPLDVALRVADDVLRQAVQGLSGLVSDCGPLNVDLAVVREVLRHGGECCLALGVARGADAGRKAMQAALDSQLVDMAVLCQAPAVLVQVTGGTDMPVRDTADAMDVLRGRLHPECRLVVGAGFDPTLAGACQVTVLGTGLAHAAARAADSASDVIQEKRT